MSGEIGPDSDSEDDEQNPNATNCNKTEGTQSCERGEGQMQLEAPEEMVPDGGWGWMVTIGAMVIGGLVVSILLSFGLFINEFVIIFPETSKAESAWIPAIMAALWNGISPLTSALVKVFSCRSVAFAGGIIMSAGLSLSFFTTNVQQLYITFGIMGGVGAGLCLTPGIILMSSYFKKRRGLASGLCMMGGGLGNLAMPSLIEYLLEEYGYRGCILILGAIMLHICAAAALFRPPDTAKKKISTAVTFSKPSKDFDMMQKGNSNDDVNLPKNRHNRSFRRSFSWWWKGKAKLPKESMLLESKSWKNPNVGAYYEMGDSICSTPPSRYRNRTISIDSSRILPEIPEEPEEEEQMAEEDEMKPMTPLTTKVKNSNGHGEHIYDNRKKQSPQMKIPDNEAGRCNSVSRHLQQLFNVAQLKTPIFYVLAICYNLTLVAYPNYVMLVPVYAVSLGMSRGEAAWLVSINSVPNTLARFAVPTASDFLKIPRKYLFCGCGLIASAAIIATMTTTEFFTMNIIMVVFGLGIGGCMGISVPLFLEYMSDDKFPPFYGMVNFIQSVLFLTATPLIGLLTEAKGGFITALIALALIQTAGSILILLDVLALKNFRPSYPGMKSNEVV